MDVTFSRLQEQLAKLDAESRRYGMQINAGKTKTLIFRRKETKGAEQIKLNGEVIEDVDNFVFLEANITWNSDSSEDIKRRIQLATGAY